MGKKNILLIIGNGFDIERGLKTSYTDFINSEIYDKYSQILSENPAFKKDYDIDYDENIPIFQHFKKIAAIQNWIDLEVEIGKLASRKTAYVNTDGDVRNDFIQSTEFMMSTFNILRECLNNYILNLDYSEKRPNNYATQLMSIVASNRQDNVQIITFNYTPLDHLSGFEIKVPVYHIHGKATEGSNTNLILGVQDDIDIPKSYSYIIKSHSPNYHSYHIIDMLDNADDIIFFVHSLGETDYPYFADFFQSQCKRTASKSRKKIRIFTYNEQARLDILYQLRIMNNKQTRMFYENSDFEIYRTEDKIDDYRIQNFFNDLIKDLSQRSQRTASIATI